MGKQSSPTKRATILLLFLAPITAELLSGSAPPLEFFNPFALTILARAIKQGQIIQ